MKRPEMLAKLEAGKLPTDVCLDKYRQLYCKVQSGEKIVDSDLGINTCALCYKHYSFTGDGCSGTCPLAKNGDGCLDKADSPYRILAGLLSDYEYNDVAWDKEKVLTAIEGMIAALKEARKYETEKTEKDTYIEGEKNCGLKVGDKVKILRVATDHEQGWKNCWIEGSMLKPGETSTIDCIDEEQKGIRLESGFSYPYFVLEKVVRKAEILNDNEEWIESAYTAEGLEAVSEDGIVPVTSTDNYDYYANLKWQMIYRVKRE